MSEVNSLNDIVENGLCIGCGLCKSIAGEDNLKMEMSDKGRLEPKEIKTLNKETLDQIKLVCPGLVGEGLPEDLVTKDSKFDLIWGDYLSLFYAWSSDNKIRFESSTGGLLNGLSLYLLETKTVNFILHTVSDPKKPMRNISQFSYDKNQLLNSNSCSRYGPASPLDRFHEALKLNEPFAFVGKPCDVGAIRMLAKSDKRVNQNCKYLLTLVCGGFQELTKAQDFIDGFNVKEDELSTFRYRGFGNPGKMYIKTKDGREFDKDYNSFWGDESNWRVPFRCKICPDAIGDTADIAALDTWVGGSPKKEDEGFNAAIVRTEKGLELINKAIEAGYINKGDDLQIENINDFQPHQVKKKKAVFARHEGMRKAGKPSINTERLRIKELYDLNSKDFNSKEEQGIVSRIKKI